MKCKLCGYSISTSKYDANEGYCDVCLEEMKEKEYGETVGMS